MNDTLLIPYDFMTLSVGKGSHVEVETEATNDLVEFRRKCSPERIMSWGGLKHSDANRKK